MKRSWVVVIALVLVAAAGVWFFQSRSGAKPPKYRTAAAERGAIEALVSATGTLQPVIQVEVGSQVSGTVARLNADFNDRVRKGQVLCQLDPASFRARAAQADAAVARAEAVLKDGRRQLRRAQELIAQKYVSQAEVEAAELAVEQREAELKQARAQSQSARVDLANTTIHAPIDGIVISRTIDLGQTVAASLQAPKLFVIANDLAQMQVETRIDEADIGQIGPGLPVRFTVDAFAERTFEGRVAQVRLEPIVEQGVVTYTTVIRTENPELKLRPGMTANVSVLVAKREDALRVPNAALRFRPPAPSGRGRGGEGGQRVGADGRAASVGGGGAMAAERPGAGGSAGSAGRQNPAAAGGPARAGRGAGRPSDGSDVDASTRGRASVGGQPELGAKGAASGLAVAVEDNPLRPGTVYVLRAGKPAPVSLMTGISDGAFTEVVTDALHAGELVIVGMDVATRGANLQPPPGMGGGGGGGGRGGRGGGR